VQIETHLVGALVGLSVTTSRVVKGFGPSSRVSHRRLTVFSSVLKESDTSSDTFGTDAAASSPARLMVRPVLRMRHVAP